MYRYIGKRLVMGVITLFILATITFFMMKAIPGNPFSRENRQISPKIMEKMIKKYGLDQPLHIQYMTYMKNAMKGDFGVSIKRIGLSVNSIISRSAPVTAKLGLVAFIVSLTVGIGLGVLSSLTKRRWVNNLVTVFATLGVSVPSFLLAIMMMIVLGVQLKLFPLVGLSTPRHYFMPALALSFYPISMITRLTRSSLRDVMNKDYITLARSKGTKEMWVIVKHGLKNALLPVITYCGPMFAYLVTGSFVVENLFSVPGIGAEFVSSVSNRDYTMIMGLTIFLGAIIIVLNLLSDIVVAIVDPRVKLEK
jgi:oligopeptide transport system permease protein